MSGVKPLKQSSSLEWLPPCMSELRVVLLGNSWSERCFVGNFILGETVFNTDGEPECLMVKRQMKEKNIVLINTPDLLHPNITSDRLKEHVKLCISHSDPGPHVFLLILQPEDFTEEQKEKLCRVLELFGDQLFDHSLVLISQPRDKRKCMKQPPLKDMIQECKYRYLNLQDLDHPELLTRLGQIVKENRGEHFNCEETTLIASEPKPRESWWSIPGAVKTGGQYVLGAVGLGSGKNQSTDASAIRIVLLGRSQDKQRKLSNFICNTQSLQRTSKQHGQWRGKPVTVVKTPDIFSLSVKTVREEVKKCVSVCSPGPNILLLLVNPSNFTVGKRQTLKFILSLFGPEASKHSMVIMTHKMEEMNNFVHELLKDCGGRHYNMVKEDHTLLMEKMEKTVCENRGTFLTFSEDSIRPEGEDFRPALNLVLCGRREAVKTSVAEAILGPTAFGSVSSSSECVKHQAEVCGRWVSLVDLPALYGQPEEKVMEKSLRCISLCDPEGVHVFIVVLPVGLLTDEDKAELETIQKTLLSRANDFTMILLATESDPNAAPVVNFVREDKDVQRLCQSCGGRYHVFNVNDKAQIPELIDSLDTMRQRPYKDKPWSYTAETFAQAQIQMIIRQKQKITNLLRTQSLVSCDKEKSPECLRIVLIGKTGSGKSSSGNTILGKKEFNAELSQISVTRRCQKVRSDVDGRQVAVVDTPGLFDTTLSREDINKEMVKCISHLAPGPHVFLLVVRLGRFTQEEKDTLKLIKEAFGKNAEKFTIVLLTGGDSLERDNQSVEEFIERKCDDSFKKLISDCGGRYHVFDNTTEHNHKQVSELIFKIETMVKENQGNCYTNEMLQEAEAAIKKKMERILEEKEEMKREREELQRKHKEEMDNMKRKMEEQRKETEKERKLKEQQLQQMKENIHKEHQEREKEHTNRKIEEEKREHEEKLQRQEWEQKFNDMEQRIKSESESKENIDRKLEESRAEMSKERENWERKQKEWWEQRSQEDEKRQLEEEEKIKKLQERYDQERENYMKQREEEDRIRREQEQNEKRDMVEKHEKALENLKKMYEEEAREKAEEFNEFREKYTKTLAEQEEEYKEHMTEKDKQYDILKALSTHNEEEIKRKHQREINDLLKCLTKKKENVEKLKKILKIQEEEMKSVKTEEEEKYVLQKHEKQKNELIQELLKEVDTSRCVIL